MVAGWRTNASVAPMHVQEEQGSLKFWIADIISDELHRPQPCRGSGLVAAGPFGLEASSPACVPHGLKPHFQLGFYDRWCDGAQALVKQERRDGRVSSVAVRVSIARDPIPPATISVAVFRRRLGSDESVRNALCDSPPRHTREGTRCGRYFINASYRGIYSDSGG